MKRARVFKLSKGFTGRNKNVYVAAKPRVEKALMYAYVSRRLKKRMNRRIWIHQINSATRQYGLKYSEFIRGLVQSNILLNRKVLSELAVQEPISFYSLVQHVQSMNLSEQRRRAPPALVAPPEQKPPQPQLSLREEKQFGRFYKNLVKRVKQAGPPLEGSAADDVASENNSAHASSS